MQSAFTALTPSHVAAVMGAGDLPHLPALVEASIERAATTLTVCTLPPDLRLASMRDAVALTDALARVAPELTRCNATLAGRRFYLPESLAAAFAGLAADAIDLRLAVDYACRPSMLNPGSLIPAASILLVPRGLRPGNFLRWQFARAALHAVDWRRFDASALADVLDEASVALPRLIAAR